MQIGVYCDELTFKQVTFEDKTGKNIGNRQVISVVNGMYRTYGKCSWKFG